MRERPRFRNSRLSGSARARGLRVRRQVFLAAERLPKTLFGAHPYANFTPTEKQVEVFKRSADGVLPSLLRPEGALFVGEFSPEKLIAEMSALRQPPAISAQPAPHPRKMCIWSCARSGAGSSAEIWRLPARIPTDKLGLANNIYGGAFNSRLVMNIREQKGYTYSPRSGMNPLRRMDF